MKKAVRWLGIALALGIGLGLAGLSLSGAAASALLEEVDLAVGARAPEHVAAGGTFVVNIQYQNLGSGPSAQDTQVSVALPDGVAFVQATDKTGALLPPDSITGNTYTWEVGALGVGECCGHIFIMEAVDEALPEGQVLVNTASITSSSPEADLSNNTAAVTSEVCEMAGSGKQAHARQVMPGDVLTYTVTLRYTNRHGTGEPQFRNVAFTDILPAGHLVRFLGWTGTVTGTQDGQTLRWQGQVRQGEALTLQYRLGVELDVVPGTVITNMARVAWENREMQLGPVSTEVILPDSDRIVGPEGDTWQHQNGYQVVIPPGAVQERTRFQFRLLFTDTQPAPLPPTLRFAHQAFEMHAFRFGEQVQLEQPVTITVPIDAGALDGLKRETLRLWRRDRDGQAWSEPSTAILDEPQALTFASEILGQFALFGEAAYRLLLPILALP